jgi:hypothetical protein
MKRVMIVLVTSLLTSTSLAFAAERAFPTGTFAATIADEDWTIRFDNKGKFVVTNQGKEVVEGKCKVKKEEIELTDLKGEYAGDGETKVGKYKWAWADKKLTFTKVEDKSPGREKCLTSSP